MNGWMDGFEVRHTENRFRFSLSLREQFALISFCTRSSFYLVNSTPPAFVKRHSLPPLLPSPSQRLPAPHPCTTAPSPFLHVCCEIRTIGPLLSQPFLGNFPLLHLTGPLMPSVGTIIMPACIKGDLSHSQSVLIILLCPFSTNLAPSAPFSQPASRFCRARVFFLVFPS